MRSCGLRGGARSSRGGPPPWRAPSLQTRGSSLGSSSPPDSWVHQARVLGSGGLERVREVKLQVVRGLRCAFFSGFSVQICLFMRAPSLFSGVSTRRRESPPRGPDPARGEPGVYVATRARTRGVHERLAPVRERGPPFAHASKCVNGHSPNTHGWGLLHPFAHVYGAVTYTESLLKRGVYFTQGRTVYDSTLQCTDARRQDVCVSLV